MTAEDRGSLYLAAGSFLDQTAEELTDIAVDLDGCAGIGLRLSGEHEIRDSGRARAIRDRLSAVGKSVFDAEVVRVSAGIDVASMEPLIIRAAEVGARHVLVVSDLERDALEESIEVFSTLQNLATGHGVSVAIEYMAWTVPWNVESALKVHASTGCRIVVDLLHHTRIGATVSDLERLARADAIAWVQVCDAPSRMRADSLVDEARHGRLIPGTGELPVRDYLAVVPLHVDVSIEVQSDDLLRVEPRERARRLLDAARRCRA